MVMLLKVKLDEESQEKINVLNENLEALIIQIKEANRINIEVLNWYQKQLDDVKNE